MCTNPSGTISSASPFSGDEVESLERRDVVSGKVKTRPKFVTLFPCKHFVLPQERINGAADRILAEMAERVAWFEKNNLLVEAQRLYQRVTYDIEMMKEIGYCSGIENYSMYLSNRRPGSRPYCLFDFFPPDFLTVIDRVPRDAAAASSDVQGRPQPQNGADRPRLPLPTALEKPAAAFEEFEQLTAIQCSFRRRRENTSLSTATSPWS